MQVITATAETHGCTAELRWGDVAYGPTINARPMVAHVEAAVRHLGSDAQWLEMEAPTMAAEDFSFMAGARLVTPAKRRLRGHLPACTFWHDVAGACEHTQSGFLGLSAVAGISVVLDQSRVGHEAC